MRTVTRGRTALPPWRKDPTRPSRLSRHSAQKTFNRPGEPRPKNGHGTIDFIQRLWQHSSGKKGIAGTVWQGYFSYGLKDEWALIEKNADYIEYQDRTTVPWTFYRISVWLARTVGHKENTPRGARWLVPLEYYRVTEGR